MQWNNRICSLKRKKTAKEKRRKKFPSKLQILILNNSILSAAQPDAIRSNPAYYKSRYTNFPFIDKAHTNTFKKKINQRLPHEERRNKTKQNKRRLGEKGGGAEDDRIYIYSNTNDEQVSMISC